MSDPYEVFAIRYGGRADRTRADSFLLDPFPHDVHAIDYYIWVVRNAERTIVVDTGFDAQSAARLGRAPFDDPPTLLAAFGIEAEAVDTVVLTHLHFDHAGSIHRFPNATFHIQSADLAYATSPLMKHAFLRWPYEGEIIAEISGLVHKGRVVFHEDGDTLAPGITLHRLDGHAVGQQGLRIATRRGAVVLATDAAPWAEHFLDARLSPVIVDARAMLESYDRLRELADSDDHIIPGHDPLVAELYPPAEGVDAPAYRLDAAPRQAIRDAVAARMPRR